MSNAIIPIKIDNSVIFIPEKAINQVIDKTSSRDVYWNQKGVDKVTNTSSTIAEIVTASNILFKVTVGNVEYILNSNLVEYILGDTPATIIYSWREKQYETAESSQTVADRMSGVNIAPTHKRMTAIVCGNSISGYDQITSFTAATGVVQPVHFSNYISGAPLEFKRTTAGTPTGGKGDTDLLGVYSYGGATLAQINADIKERWVDVVQTANIIPDIAIGLGLVENDIAGGVSVSDMQNRVDEWVSMVQGYWYGVKIVLTTPVPSFGFNTPAEKSAYKQISNYIKSLENGVDIFVANGAVYESTTDPATPQATEFLGTIVSTTLTVSDSNVELALNSSIGFGDYYARISAVGGGGTYTVSTIAGSAPEGEQTFKSLTFTQDSIHPNAAGACVLGRELANVYQRVAKIFYDDKVGYSNNIAISGSTSAPVGSGTVCTDYSMSTLISEHTAVFTANQPTMDVEYTTPSSSDFVTTTSSNFGAITIASKASISAYIKIEIIDGAELIASFLHRPRILDSEANNTLFQYMSAGSASDTMLFQDGDVLTFITPPLLPTAGTIEQLTNFLQLRIKPEGGTVKYRVINQGYYLIS